LFSKAKELGIASENLQDLILDWLK
jgi:hypothetical protein